MMALAKAVLADIRRLPGAACAGRSELFDRHPANHPYRDVDQAEALRTCASCPALAACRAWLDGLPSRWRPTGVIAGRVLQPATGSSPTGRRRGRPPKHRPAA
jgi:WhiB family redox-sensing transcriptional regulator